MRGAKGPRKKYKLLSDIVSKIGGARLESTSAVLPDDLQISLSPFQSDLPFMSTPNFVEKLTDLARDLLARPSTLLKRQRLRDGLTEINACLPAQVYVPLLAARHKAVLSIQIDETRLYITNRRAPFCVVCEVWRPATELLTARKHRETGSSDVA